jgi:hypothetical protein
MAKTIQITRKPTFDLKEFVIDTITEDGICFIRSSSVFKFEHVFGNLENRSRVLRQDRDESKIVEQIISASIDAGFCGPLVWKTKLTKLGLDIYLESKDKQKFAEYLKDCQQIHLFPSPAGNYYERIYDDSGNIIEGTSQTDLEPDIIFTI